LRDPLKGTPGHLTPNLIDSATVSDLSKLMNLLGSDEAKQWYQAIIDSRGASICDKEPWYCPPAQVEASTSSDSQENLKANEEKRKEIIINTGNKLFQVVTESTRIYEQNCVIVDQGEPNCDAEFRLAKVECTYGYNANVVAVRFYELKKGDEEKREFTYKELNRKSKRVEVQRKDMLVVGDDFLAVKNNRLMLRKPVATKVLQMLKQRHPASNAAS